MKPAEWARRVIAVAGPPAAKHAGKNAVDLEYVVAAKDLGFLQDVLDMVPTGGQVRLGVIAKPSKSERDGTDEQIDGGMVRRFTLAERTEKGSDLIGRVFGPDGGYERMKNSYKSVSKNVVVQFRFPTEGKTR